MAANETNEISGTLVFYVNGKKIIDSNIDPEWTLLYYLRAKLRLCGTKLGCGEGGCGACTVMVSRFDRGRNIVIHIPVNACLAPICSMHGLAVTTVEGIGSTKTKLHPVQERIAKTHGSQCGFCTPGMVMSMYVLLRQSPKPKMEELEETLQGNLCRCTGYRPILDGFKTFTEEWEAQISGSYVNGSDASCGMGDKCCKVQNGTTEIPAEGLFDPNEFSPYHPSQEPIFPPELKLLDVYDRQRLEIKGKNVTWYRPTKYIDFLSLKCTFPEAKIVVGNTEVGVETKFKRMFYPVIIQPTQIKELIEISEGGNGISVGASVTLTELGDFLKYQIRTQPEEKSRIFKAIVDVLFWFAGKQIRSVGSIGGNIMTGSPISDLLPILMACRVELEIEHLTNGLRTVVLDDKFFVGYRKSIIHADEVLKTVRIPFSTKSQYFKAYKQARRREDDIAIVNIAVNVIFENNSNIVSDIHLAFGGMSFKTITAPKTEANLKGLPWNKESVEMAFNWLLEDLPLDPSAPGGMIAYRKSLTLGLFFKAFLAISEQLPCINELNSTELSGSRGIHESKQINSQYFKSGSTETGRYNVIQKPMVHLSAFKQAAGEAVYCDDLPRFENELFLAFVVSSRAHAKIISVDPFDALQMEGVRGIVSVEDIGTDRNVFGGIVPDEKIFYYDVVTSQGQIICAVLANDISIAQRAARKVKIEYQDLEPIVITIEDAIKERSFFKEVHRSIRKGPVEEVFSSAPHVLEGQCRMGGQEHFYFETQAVIAVPKAEDGEIELYSSTQHPSEVAALVAEALETQQNKIICKVKRIGGGFGGKESKAAMVAIPVAIAAKKFRRPIRCMLDRDEDMLMTGGRHPFLMKYKAAFDDTGKILGCDVHLYLNGGYSTDLSTGVCERALLHVDNAYNIPAFRVKGTICKTNLPSNTAFRGFGGPQGMFVAENIIDDIAEYLGISRIIISERNLYKEGDLTHYNQLLEDCTMDKCWKECIHKSQYHARRKMVDEYNRRNKYKKRGITMVPTKFGIAFGAKFLNQAGALVLVYTDGSVLLHHGGIEMGQGLYTKMIQVASEALSVPPEKIHTSATSTETVPNTSPTAASTGSDLNGMAVLNACNEINERLKPYKNTNPKGGWDSWVKQAYFDRISLSAVGFYATPELGHDWDTNEGNIFRYFTYGAACTEVEIDTLTGDHKVLRTDIVMDLGESINPAIDIGQVEGAFMQGYGLFILEELVYSPTGILYTKGPGAYKIPGFGDIPGEFNVSLLKGVSNPKAVYSSKAVGEPPLFLASSALFAIKDAVKAARLENGCKEPFRLNAPATAAEIRMVCRDTITSRIKTPEPGTYTPWNVTV
ncbi:xanthine dehydrogenase isoform X2 [Cylas formicarius]|uniref:xanthine dehydrogenase isoform X2 n=1 Tax=Cylas formicarius TaxID=197179 RepID=UPI00295852EC|nr:xanthine dehydrogenase isoform X2 [Cylas formicarius]